MKKYIRPVIISNGEMNEETRENVVAIIPAIALGLSAVTALNRLLDDKALTESIKCIRKVG